MTAESIGGHLETDKGWHARLLCKLSDKITRLELKKLQQLMIYTDMVPSNAIAESEDFFAVWEVLTRQNLVRVGEYGFLGEYLEMLNRMDLAEIIKVYSKKIDDFRQTQSQKMAKAAASTATTPVDEEDDDPLLEGFVVVCRPAE